MRDRKHLAFAGAELALLLALPVGCGQTEPGPEPVKGPVPELTFQEIYVDAVPLSCEEIDITAGGGEGMISMDQSILNLYKNKQISREVALEHADNPDHLQRRLG